MSIKNSEKHARSAAERKAINLRESAPIASGLHIPNSAQNPRFPQEVLEGTALQYLVNSAVGHVEMYISYIAATGFAATSSILGRAVWIEGGAKPIYPNAYYLLIGPTGKSRKSTVRDILVDIVREADKRVQEKFSDGEGEKQYPDILFQTTISTTEGFIHHMRTKETRTATRTVSSKDEKTGQTTKESEKYLKEIEIYPKLPEFEGIRLLLHIDEIRSLFAKRKQQSSEGIISTIVEAYSMPIEMQNTSKTASQTAEYPSTTIFGLSTQEWYEKGVRLEDIFGGMANRFWYYLPDVEDYEKVPISEGPDPQWLNRFLNHLFNIRYEFHGKHQKFMFDVESAKLITDAYYKHHDELDNPNADEMFRAICAREPDAIKKLSLMFALLDTQRNQGDMVVRRVHVEKAMKVVMYLRQSAMKLYGTLAVDEDAEHEERIMRTLRRKDGSVKHTDLRRAINFYTMSSERFNRALSALVLSGRIEAEKVGEGTKSATIYHACD